MKNVTILGAGLVGSLLAILLAKRRHKVTVYERRPDMRKEKISAGRSINLALSDRGWKALDLAGIGDVIRKEAIPMKGRMTHDVHGKLNFIPYGKENQAIYSVSRAGLNMTLMDCAEENPNMKIHFNEKCLSVDLEKEIIELENQTSKKITKAQSEIIFGSDGMHSSVRNSLEKFIPNFQFSKEPIEHGYKELLIPADKNGKWILEKNALHIWPREKFMLIALPNLDGSFTCTLFFPMEGKPSFAQLKTKTDVTNFWKEIFPDAVPLMPTLLEDFFHNPTSMLGTVRCYPWTYEDKLCLIGDAAHAIVPFFGQGMNAGFEDCRILDELMDKSGDDWKNIFPAFEKSRKPNTDAIAELALENFVEMRDKVADERFLLRKKIETKIAEMYPAQFIPLYSMVTFSPQIPYAEAQRIGKRQDELLERILSVKGIEKKWNDKETGTLIHDLMKNWNLEK